MSDQVLQVFAPGTVVQLRSGGPLLTVTGSTATNASVIYFNTVTGLYEKFTTAGACLREANQAPVAPANAGSLRHTSVAKSSMS